MLIALNQNGERQKAKPKAKGKCPTCESEVVAKCGTINVWHWAHLAADCDPWTEPESDWHLWWKSLWPNECVEVTMRKDGALHRADICTPDGMVIELQHSAISPEEIAAREDFYCNMVWLFDLREAHETSRLAFRSFPDNKINFRWSHARKSFLGVSKPSFFDVGYSSLFQRGDLYKNFPNRGKGSFRDWRMLFIEWGLMDTDRAIQKAGHKDYWEPYSYPSSRLTVPRHIHEDRMAYLARDYADWCNAKKASGGDVAKSLRRINGLDVAIRSQYSI